MINNCMWLCIEGIDRAGKTSQSLELKKRLIDKGYKCYVSHVFDTDIGNKLKEIFLEKRDLTNEEEILLLLLTRLRYYNLIKSISENHDIIITDRMFLSIEAMQGEKNQKFYANMKKVIFGELEPDVTFIIDLPAEIAFKRKKHEKIDRIEERGIAFHESIRNNFLKLAKIDQKRIIIDGTLDFSTVSDVIENKVTDILGATYGFKVNYTPFNCEYGEFGLYVFKFGNNKEILTLYRSGNGVPLVRIQSQCILGFVFHSKECDCGDQLRRIMEIMKLQEHALIIYLTHQEARGYGLFKKLDIMRETKNMGSLEKARIKEGAEQDIRDYSEVVKVLNFFKIKKLCLLTKSQKKVDFLKKNNFVIEQVRKGI